MNEPSPYHAGEQATQERMGVRDRAEVAGRRIIRPVLIDQHREFYGELPFLVLGSVDTQGQPWASIVTGQPGFLSTPDDRTLSVNASAIPGDPLALNLTPGADLGVLGMQLETRRRNRMSGQVSEIREDGFSLTVLQAFGNCPKFIQTRDVAVVEAKPSSVASSDQLDARARDIIARADTLFIASTFRDRAGAVNQGSDVSHRGGKPGFVKIEDDRTFVFPDFAGNNAFNTVGNLVQNPRAGFLFPDFRNGDVLSMTGTVEMVWDGPEVDAFEGAKRLLRFHADEVRRIAGGLALTTEFKEYSPHLEKTGAWAS